LGAGLGVQTRLGVSTKIPALWRARIDLKDVKVGKGAEVAWVYDLRRLASMSR
jgi:hypothetical protein